MKLAIIQPWLKSVTTFAKNVGSRLREPWRTSTNDVRSAMNLLISNGQATHNLKTINQWEEQVERERQKLNQLFPGKRQRKNEILDKVSLIRKYQQIWLRAKFPFGIPKNYITPIMLTEILKGR